MLAAVGSGYLVIYNYAIGGVIYRLFTKYCNYSVTHQLFLQVAAATRRAGHLLLPAVVGSELAAPRAAPARAFSSIDAIAKLPVLPKRVGDPRNGGATTHGVERNVDFRRVQS